MCFTFANRAPPAASLRPGPTAPWSCRRWMRLRFRGPRRATPRRGRRVLRPRASRRPRRRPAARAGDVVAGESARAPAEETAESSVAPGGFTTDLDPFEGMSVAESGAGAAADLPPAARQEKPAPRPEAKPQPKPEA